MQFVCSHCHTPLDAEPEDEHMVCPNCKAEAGLEPVKTETPDAMRYFGVVLLIAAVLTFGGVMAGIAS